MKRITLVEKDLNKFIKKANDCMINLSYKCNYRYVLDDKEIYCVTKRDGYDDWDFYCYKKELIKDKDKNYTLIYNTTFDMFELENKSKSNGTI